MLRLHQDATELALPLLPKLNSRPPNHWPAAATSAIVSACPSQDGPHHHQRHLIPPLLVPCPLLPYRPF